VLDNTVLIEIDETDKNFIAKAYTEERHVVRCSKLSFEDAGFSPKTKSDSNKRIKVGIYSISKLIKTLELYTNTDFNIIFKYDEVIGETNEYKTESISIHNKNLKTLVECAELSIFKYISDDKFYNQIASSNSLNSFSLTPENISQILTLCELDNDDKYLSFKGEKDIFAYGKTFELKVSQGSGTNFTMNILKEQFQKLDKEDYVIEVSEDRLVLKSNNSDSTIVFSRAEKDEKYDGK
jgi:hypothetical protein